MCLEFGEIIELFLSRLVFRELKADDTTSAIADRQDLASLVKRHRREQILLADSSGVGFTQLRQSHHVKWFEHHLHGGSGAGLHVSHLNITDDISYCTNLLRAEEPRADIRGVHDGSPRRGAEG